MDKSTEARQRAFAEDQLDPSQMTPDQLRRKDARDRKRVERAREKQKKEVAAKMSEADRVLQGKYGDEFTIIKAGIQGAATNHKLWEENRRHLTQAQREAYEARESE